MGVNILLTGATGFLGRHLAAVLHAKSDVSLIAVVRRFADLPASRIVTVSRLEANTDFSTPLVNQQVVIHAAACAHVLKGELDYLRSEYRSVNVEGTLNLARQAAAAGVQRFIFISSIGVNGNASEQPFTEEDKPIPLGLYAQSKLSAEQGLWDIHRETGMELVVIRPPLVYGSNAPGNFGILMRWVKKGIPLPLGSINNKRSLVAVGNLVDLIVTCIDHPAAANEVFLAGDGEDISTTDLLRGVARAMNESPRLVPVPPSLLMLAATLLGKKALAQGLLGSLQIDISKARNLLGWEPPVSVEEGLRRCIVKE